MAKPKGATLTRLFAVSDSERKAFWQNLEAKKNKSGPDPSPAELEAKADNVTIPITGVPETGVHDTGLPLTGLLLTGVPDPNPSRPLDGMEPVKFDRELDHEKPPSTGIPTKAVPVSGTPALRAWDAPHEQSELNSVSAAPIGRPKIREAIKVQDGHSLGEQAVYSALWANGQHHNEDCRRLTIGYRTLSDVCGLTVNNCKANLLSLIRKLAIEPIASHTNIQGTTYLIYGYAAILRRRRLAGMTHIVKTKGVVFVHPATGVPISGVPSSSRSRPGSGIHESTKGTPISDKLGIPVPETLIRNKEFIEQEASVEEPSSSFTEVVATANSLGVTLDDDAVRRIVLRCQAFDAAATNTEIAYFVRAKLLQLRKSQNVENPVGLLIKAVPQYFAPPATELSAMRVHLHRQAQLEIETSREAARAILSDPDADESDRDWARITLGELMR